MENAISQSVEVEEEVKLEVLNLGQRILGEIKEAKPSSVRKAKVVKIGGDSGKSHTKVSMIIRENGVDVVYPEIIYTSSLSNDNKAVTDYTEEFIIDGVRHLVGDPTRLLNASERREQSKVLPLHRTCMIAAVVKLLNKLGYVGVEEVQLTVNMPLSDYLDVSEQRKLIRLYESKKTVVVKYNGKTYSFKLKVLPYYEALGALLNKFEEYEDKRVVSIDFGSRNVGYATFNKMNIVEGKSGTTPDGVNKLLTQVQQILSNNKITTISDDEQLISIIKGENQDIPVAVLELVKNRVHNYLDGIYGTLFDFGIDIEYTDIIFSGGGVDIFKPYIHKVFKKASENEKIHFIDNPQFANSIGSLKLFG